MADKVNTYLNQVSEGLKTVDVSDKQAVLDKLSAKTDDVATFQNANANVVMEPVTNAIPAQQQLGRQLNAANPIVAVPAAIMMRGAGKKLAKSLTTTLAQVDDGSLDDVDLGVDVAPAGGEKSKNFSNDVKTLESDLTVAGGALVNAGSQVASAAGDLGTVAQDEAKHFTSTVNGVSFKLVDKLGLAYSCGDLPCYQVFTYVIEVISVGLFIWAFCMLWSFFLSVFWAVLGLYIAYIVYELVMGTSLNGQVQAQFSVFEHYCDIIAVTIASGLNSVFPGVAATFNDSEGGQDLQAKYGQDSADFNKWYASLNPYNQGLVVGFFVFLGFFFFWNCCCRNEYVREYRRKQALLAETDMPEDEEAASADNEHNSIQKDEDHIEAGYTAM